MPDGIDISNMIIPELLQVRADVEFYFNTNNRLRVAASLSPEASNAYTVYIAEIDALIASKNIIDGA